MGEYAGTLPASFQPWTRHDTSHKSFASTLGRIHDERGQFRLITEASLQDEIDLAAVSNDRPLSRGSSLDDEDERPKHSIDQSSSGPAMPARREQLARVRQDVLGHIASAQNETLIALDFVSLLLSKDSKAAEATISPVLKDSVPLGSLGMDMWAGMTADAATEATDKLLARGQRIRFLSESAEGLLKASDRLKDTVERQRRYWEGIRGIKDAGWNVCRLPRGGLGVRYGFNEARGEFARRGVASLRMGPGGDVTLDRGFRGGDKTLRVRILRGGKVVAENDRSQVAGAPAHGANDMLDTEGDGLARDIKAARDSLFDEELWHEAMQETRLLGTYGVTMRGDTIVVPLTYLDQQDLESHHDTQNIIEIDLDSRRTYIRNDDSTATSPLATGICAALRVMLTQSHQARLRARSAISAPLSLTKASVNGASILRPLLACAQQLSAQSMLHLRIDRLRSALLKAGLTCNVLSTFDLDDRLGRITSVADLFSVASAPLNSMIEIQLQDDAPSGVSLENTRHPSNPATSLRVKLRVSTDSERPAVTFTLESQQHDKSHDDLTNGEQGSTAERAPARAITPLSTASLAMLLQGLKVSVTAFLVGLVAKDQPQWEADPLAGRVIQRIANDGMSAPRELHVVIERLDDVNDGPIVVVKSARVAQSWGNGAKESGPGLVAAARQMMKT